MNRHNLYDTDWHNRHGSKFPRNVSSSVEKVRPIYFGKADNLGISPAAVPPL